VAVSLCAGLKAAGHKIISVTSKGGDSARALAATTGAHVIKDLTFPETCDILILAVTDTAISEIASKITVPEKTIVVHTAGSVPLSALCRKVNAGVLYPLQTFTIGFPPDMSKVPFFIEATDENTLTILRELGESIGAGVWDCDTEQRKKLHLAAVLTNNFSNFMMTSGEMIATEAGIDPSLLNPLIEETARKAVRTGPAMAQTGPAMRLDDSTVKSHIDLLSFMPEYQKLYRLISKMISAHYRKGMK